jgi:hypothetical protein
MKAVIVYWSKSGNTEKVAHAIKDGFITTNVDLTFWKLEEADEHAFLDYDLYCLGFPSYNWHTPTPVTNYLQKHHRKHRNQELIKLNSPRIPNKYALIFCTYSGPHTGLDEATPAGKYAAQYFEHVGIPVIAEWYVLCEFIGWDEGNLLGRMGDIRGTPTNEDLLRITTDTIKLVKFIKKSVQ